MKVLVVGTGAREHAICDALKDDVELYAYMSKNNPGIAKISTYKIGDEGEVDKVAEFAKENGIELAVIGPEAPLGKGIVNALEDVGVPCVGPAQESARIETDKSFMRNLFEKYEIAGSVVYKVFDNFDDIDKFLDEFDRDVVVKPVGLTGGKGVKIVGDHLRDNQDAKLYAKEVFETEMGGFAKVILEEKIVGEEFTIQAFCDGEHLVAMPAAQDHPHAFENDQGLITGGMGSYTDTDGLLPFLSQEDYDAAVAIMKDTLKAIAKETTPYKGILYGQFMLSKDGPKLIEYNARFGDPETQVVLPRLKTDIVDIFEAVCDGTLDKIDVEWEDNACVCVVEASGGYPKKYQTGYEIKGLTDIQDNIFVYHAGTKKEDNIYYTAGGRVLGITAKSKDLDTAIKDAYNAVKNISFTDVHYRKDIGVK